MGNLTKDLVDELINASKLLKYSEKYIYFPLIGKKLKLNASSTDGRYEFNFIVSRVVVRPDVPELKVTMLILYKNVSLMRIDIAGSDHYNCEEAIYLYPDLKPVVSCPHIHIFDENFNIAYPLTKYGEINKVEDLLNIFIEFLEDCRVKNLHDYGIGLQIEERRE